MLKKETLKQAIDAIAARDPEIGYSLTELFGTGRIDTDDEEQHDIPGGHYCFRFNGRRVPVKRINYFIEGAAAVEQSLLIQYGEMARKQALGSSPEPVDYTRAGQSIRIAGLMRLVCHEIERAYGRLGIEPDGGPHRRRGRVDSEADARRLLAELHHETPKEDLPSVADDPRVLFSGAVNADTPAFFVSFPYTLNALMQVADMDLTFFSVRFILRCLCNGTAQNLFACLVDGAIAGLVYLRYAQKAMYTGLEIKYITSASDARADRVWKHPAHRGVGTFLVAGVWLLWKNMMPHVQEIFLDAEIQTLGFYEEIGFEKRRPYVYVLARPDGYLLNALAVMVDRSRSMRDTVIHEIQGLIRTRVRLLAHRKAGDRRRDRALAFIKLCLLSRTQPQLAHSAATWLLKRQARIPEAGQLLQWAVRHGRIRLVDTVPPLLDPLLVFKNAEMQQHLQGIFHLESAHRLKAIDTILDDAVLSGKWVAVNGRTALKEELVWVHTPEHIARIAATAGRPIVSIDVDTQTTKGSYAAACLAVGGVFSLLDAILSTSSQRGFAAVRPPGHHAEPNKAMGFCLFNNTALGACYLKHAGGLKRVMIVDIDAHHGNGTQAAFFNCNDVLFISLHQFPCYPGSGNFSEIGNGPGEGYSVNVPLDRGMGDREFVQVIARLVDPLASAFEPQMILVSCGFDLYQHDRLAGLNGTPGGYAVLTHLLCRMADRVCGGRIAFIMEGGYSVQGIRACGLSVIQELCGIPTGARAQLDKMLGVSPAPFPALQKAIAIHRKYWSILNG
jgi:acetoin utilization deacetylase AcuC-like enzyme